MMASAVTIVVDDPEGELAARLSVRQLFPEKCTDKLVYLLPIGSILVLRNPTFSKSADDNEYRLHSNDPSDVVFLSQDECRSRFPELTWKEDVPTKYHSDESEIVQSWKDVGNVFFLWETYIAACNAYTIGLKTDPGCVPLLSNRSAAFLKRRSFAKALQDADEVLRIEPSHQKAIYRKANSLCGLKMYQEAVDFLTHLPKDQVAGKSLNSLLEKVGLYLRQSKTGDYDVRWMFENSDAPEFDFADYTGPVEVRQSPGKGRGLFATEDVKPGQLLIASKAFAICEIPKTTPRLSGISFEVLRHCVNTSTPVPVSGTDKLNEIVTKKLRMEPESRNEVYKLFAGRELGFLSSEKGDNTDVVDERRIGQICGLNSFRLGTSTSSKNGLWIGLPPMINHSCYDWNCSWLIRGDFFLVRAGKPIVRDQEILISYVEPCIPFAGRLVGCKSHEFTCNCQLCEKQLSTLNEADERWLFDLRRRFPSEQLHELADIEVLKDRIQEKKSALGKDYVWSWEYREALKLLATLYKSRRQYVRAAATYAQVIELMREFAPADWLLEIYNFMFEMYTRAGLTTDAKKCHEKLVHLEKLFFGET